MWRTTLVAALWLAAPAVDAADDFVRPLGPLVALTHVRVIDGTGAPAKDDQTVIVKDGTIAAIGSPASVPVPTGATVLDLRGRTVVPGLVGMHDHLFYQLEPGRATFAVPAHRTFAKLYLASGVTTIRTAGALDFDADARLKRDVDAGRQPGPTIHLSSPYLGAMTSQPDPAGVAALVTKYADRGATSFKAYTTLRASELEAAIKTAHARGLPVTGHLCAVGFREAAALGIDNLEHGAAFDSEWDPEKRPDECPNTWKVFEALVRMNTSNPDTRRTIEVLVRHNVALTSTLAVIESYAINESDVDPRVLPLIATRYQNAFQMARDRRKDPQQSGRAWWVAVLRAEMAFERAFVAAGGTLMAGADPTGWGAIVAGYGDERNLELLVTAGFSPEQAIRIGTANGAAFLRDRDGGTIAAGKRADLVVVTGNPAERIAALRDVEIVFKRGVAYDPQALTATTAGTLGALTLESLLTPPVCGVLALLAANRAWRLIGKRRRRLATA